MNYEEDFDLNDFNLSMRPWGESRVRLMIAGVVQTLSLTLLWGQIADVWQIARTVTLSEEVSDEWYF